MKRSYKVILINVSIAIVGSLLFTAMMQEMLVFLIALGSICLIMGIGNFVVGLILILLKSHEWGKAFLVGSGVLILLGTGICGPMLAFS